MTTLAEVLNDLRVETQVLDDVLSTLDEAGWRIETPAVGWDSRDTIGHLAGTDDLMYESITSEPQALLAATAEATGGADPSPTAVDDFTAWQIEKVRKLSWQDVYAWWHSSTARLHELLGTLDPAQRYPWGPNKISPLSLCSARLMETWAHSLDVHAAAGVEYIDTDRLRHIAHLGVRALPYAFMLERLDAPGAIRAELTAPDGEQWSFGPDDAPTVIRGTAGDWCRVVARRDRDGAAGRLQGEGPDAANAIEHGRAFL
ncbi:MAG TPA: maleylpyruvate isomerase family mycothiol-dependent enzyme [Actinomycetota bacterium]|jgi:uncharacterized protein (TIGR03084 family)|nr:maleylpyruvate isomerase family mycothiol-dependent enzyme [Actinomycetota bacterium]